MPLSEFYLMNDEQIASLHEQLAENFYDDDLYKTVFMDDRTRLKTLRYLFRHYVKALKPYCHFLADSAECRSDRVITCIWICFSQQKSCAEPASALPC